MPSKDITREKIRNIIQKLVENIQEKPESPTSNWFTGWLTVDDKQKVQIDKKKLEQFSNIILDKMIKEGLFERTNQDIGGAISRTVEILVMTPLFIGGVLPFIHADPSEETLALSLFIGIICVGIGSTILACHAPPDVSWGILGAGLECIGIWAMPVILDTYDDFFDSIFCEKNFSLKSADDCAMFFIKKVQTAAENHNQSGRGLGLVDSLSTVDLKSVEDYSKEMLGSLAKGLPDADKEIFNKAEQVIKDGSYKDIKSIDDLKAVELEGISRFTE